MTADRKRDKCEKLGSKLARGRLAAVVLFDLHSRAQQRTRGV